MSTLADYPSFPSNLTWDEFLALPDELRNASLINGKVVVNPPNAQNELVVWNLGALFREWIRAAPGRGEVSTQQPVKINDRRGYQPDFAWYPPQACAPRGELRSYSGLPGLVVEVLSPSTQTFDRLRKRRDYERIRIGEAWFVSPNPTSGSQQLVACQRKEADEPFVDVEVGVDDNLTSPLLEGFELQVSRLFEY